MNSPPTRLKYFPDTPVLLWLPDGEKVLTYLVESGLNCFGVQF